jgi:acyl-CoA-binding protein
MDEFYKCATNAKKLENINNDDKLFLYANYKQAVFGNNNNPKPSIFNRVEMAKWKAWNDVKDVSKEESMNNYSQKVKFLEKN